MLNTKSFFALTAVVLFSAVPGLGQQNISPEKKALIQELRELTEPGIYSMSASQSATPRTKEPYTSQVENDAELTDAKKQELKRFIAESNERIDGLIRDFFADKAMMKQISEGVGFQVYDKSFTEAELKELIAFYQTPTGQKALKFMPTVRKQLEKAFGEAFDQRVKEFLTPKMEAEIEQIQTKIREAKAAKNVN